VNSEPLNPGFICHKRLYLCRGLEVRCFPFMRHCGEMSELA